MKNFQTETLKSDDVGRRLRSQSGRHEVAAKVLTNDEGEEFLVVRLWVGSKPGPKTTGWSEPSQWSHFVFGDEQNIVAQGAGTRERDSWAMVEKILKVKNIVPSGERPSDRRNRFVWEPGDVTVHTEEEVREMLGRDPEESVERMRARSEDN